MQKISSSTATIEPNECFYTILNGTAVSTCNRSAVARTITVAEAQGELGLIVSKCGADGNYNGGHYTTDLSFKIYGVRGGPTFRAPVAAFHGQRLSRREDPGKLRLQRRIKLWLQVSLLVFP